MTHAISALHRIPTSRRSIVGAGLEQAAASIWPHVRGVLIRIRDNSAKGSVFRGMGESVRSAAALIVAVSLLLPLLPAILSPPSGAASCGARCCRSARACTCRHRSLRLPRRQGVQFTSESPCSAGCGQFASPPDAPGLKPPHSALTAVPPVSAVLFPHRSSLAWIRSRFESVRFQRPPPSTL